MREIQADDATTDLAALLEAVAEGETLVITRGGSPVARLVPEEDYDQEKARKAVEDLQAWRKTLPRTDMTIEDILSARDEGRR
ncbi:MAG: type II toxin-antitoxin system prevent-host-death family antitoxin [Alphaproteobacteria bacterium]|jgi:prevent-host-death family protein|nr:type II toxin-antitoxin system prevent-host-death family antitoxin [Alphaproteobacteria bacterium]